MDLIGNFGDDDLVAAAAGVFPFPLGAQAEAAATGAIGLEDGVARLDQHAAGREIGPGHVLDQLLDAGLRMLDEMQQRRTQLVDVVRRNIGRHADGDAGRAVGEQVRERGGEHARFLLASIVIGGNSTVSSSMPSSNSLATVVRRASV